MPKFADYMNFTVPPTPYDAREREEKKATNRKEGGGSIGIGKSKIWSGNDQIDALG